MTGAAVAGDMMVRRTGDAEQAPWRSRVSCVSGGGHRPQGVFTLSP